ncbi:MAG TPA: methyltransferase domain-containing protein [Syntrophorhabdaceae bacterium]|nr:methyltransferase domain-containing protein [Syntrophorhabdaceae bacterium]
MKKYRWNAEDYSASSCAQFAWAMELMEKLRLRGSERVLDVGCGDGKVSLEIAKRLPHGFVLGIDNSEEMIEHARHTYPKDHYPHVDFQVLDALHLAFKNDFDLVFSNAALHWVRNHQGLLKGIERSLKKDGRIFLQMGGKGNAQAIVDIAQAMIQSHRWDRFYRGFTFPYGFYGPDEYEPWLVAAALRPLRIELIDKDMTQKGREGLASWVRTTWLPYIQRLPADLQDGFIGELVDTYAERFPQDELGLIHVHMVRLEVEALKGG